MVSVTLIGTGFLCVNPLFSCSLETESLFQFFLNCHFLINICETLLEELAKIDLNILNLYDSIVEVLLYASSKYDMNQNSYTLNATLKNMSENQRGFLVRFCKNILL